MRRGLLIAGGVVLAAVWLGPLPEMAGEIFSAHMTMHMGVVAVAAPLVALGLAGGRYDPVRRYPRPFHPILASVIELVIVWSWHAPGLHHFARSSSAGLVMEQGMFLTAGLMVWLSAFGGGKEGDAASTGLARLFDTQARMFDTQAMGRKASGVVGLLLTAMHMTLLGALLALASRPLYHGDVYHGDVASIGVTAIQDQHLGGAIMLLVGGISYLAGGLWLTVGLLKQTVFASEESA